MEDGASPLFQGKALQVAVGSITSLATDIAPCPSHCTLLILYLNCLDPTLACKYGTISLTIYTAMVGVLSRRSYHIIDSHEKRFILIPLPLQWAGSHLVGAFVQSDLQNICIVVFDNIVFKLLYPYNMYNNI